jgi:hypothetical protein
MVLFQAIGFIFRNYYWVEQQFKWDPYIYQKYLRKFVKLDQGKIEVMGTGKILSIIQKGMEESTTLLLGVITQLTRIVCTLGF